MSNEHLAEDQRQHNLVTRSLHWGSGMLLVYLLIRNGETTNALFSPSAMGREVAFAFAVLVLFGARLIWVRMTDQSSLPPSAPRWERRLAKTVHMGIYSSLLGLIVTGFGIASTVPFAADVLGFAWPQQFRLGVLRMLLDVHEQFAHALLLLLFMHVVGAFWHLWVRRDGVWQSMVIKLSWPKRATTG